MTESAERISAVMATTARRWLDLTATVAEDLLERPAVAGEWSAVDCLRHLLQADRHIFSARIEQFMAGVKELTPFDPAAIPPAAERTARELAEAFARSREENLDLVGKLRPEDLERKAVSRRLGLVTLGDLLHQWAIHDLEHLAQAERALLQAFLVGSGPVRAAFRALDLEGEPVEAPSP